jgi:hypothetical protein
LLYYTKTVTTAAAATAAVAAATAAAVLNAAVTAVCKLLLVRAEHIATSTAAVRHCFI